MNRAVVEEGVSGVSYVPKKARDLAAVVDPLAEARAAEIVRCGAVIEKNVLRTGIENGTVASPLALIPKPLLWVPPTADDGVGTCSSCLRQKRDKRHAD